MQPTQEVGTLRLVFIVVMYYHSLNLPINKNLFDMVVIFVEHF